MGYLEEFHAFGDTEVKQVIADIRQEFELPVKDSEVLNKECNTPELRELTSMSLENVDDRLGKMERSIISVIDALKKMLPTTNINSFPDKDT
jgi:hypothetical protein